MTIATEQEPFELLLHFTRDSGGDKTYVDLPMEPLKYQRHFPGGTVSIAEFPWNSESITKGFAVLRKDAPSEEVLAGFGDVLWTFLNACKASSAIEDAVRKGQPIRITLLSAAAELYDLPWELTRINAGQTLAQVEDCTIRYTWTWEKTPAAVANPEPLPEGGRILFAWSHGDNEVPWKSHLKEIGAACSKISSDEQTRRGFFDPERDVLNHASYKAIKNKLSEAIKEDNGKRAYRIVHLLCHGKQLDGGKGIGLLLTGDDEERASADSDNVSLEKETISPDKLTTLFPRGDLAPRLIVLCACLGSDAGAPDSRLGSVALAIHRGSFIESVVASRFLLSKAGSITLCQKLYSALLGDFTSIESALSAARSELSGSLDYAALQLYQNTMGWDTRPVIIRPYRGLRHYQEPDKALFFGRNDEIQEACSDYENLIQSSSPRFLMVMGASGTGKSSLVFAGIVPALIQRYGKAFWYVVPMRPRSGIEAIDNACAARAGKQLLLIVDQFEEIFTDIADKDMRNAFVQKIWTLASDKDSGVTVIATLRVDYLARCGEVVLPDGLFLDAVANDQKHQIFVNRMTEKQLREVIERPAQRTGLALGEGLVSQMLKDAGDEPGALPLMQVALEKLWENRSRGLDGRGLLNVEGYENLTRELTSKADGIIDGLGDDVRKKAAKRLLVQLVDMRSDASPYTRRRMLKDDLRKGPADEEGIFDAVLEGLTAKFLLVASNDQSGHAIVEIAHEQIVRSWDKLRTWLKEERQRLAEMARFAAWLEQAKALENYFLRDGELHLAIELRQKYASELRPEEVALVERSQKEKERIAEEELKRRLALRDALVLVGARSLLAQNEPVWAAKVLLEVTSPARTRGWFQAALESRRKIRIWSTLDGELATDARALMDQSALELVRRDDRFVLAETEKGTIFGIGGGKIENRPESAHAEGEPVESEPSAQFGSILWAPHGAEEKVIAQQVDLLDRADDGMRLLFVEAGENFTGRLVTWTASDPDRIRAVDGAPEGPKTGGVFNNGRGIWLQDTAVGRFYLWENDQWTELNEFRMLQEGAFCGGVTAHKRYLVALQTPEQLDVDEPDDPKAVKIEEGYIFQLGAWSGLHDFEPGTSALFTPDGSEIEITNKTEQRTVRIRGARHYRPKYEGRLVGEPQRDTILQVKSADGNRRLSVERATYHMYDVHPPAKTVLRIMANDATEEPLELEGPEISPTADTSSAMAAFSLDGHSVLMVLDGKVWVWPVASVSAMIEELQRASRDCLPPDKRCEYLGETSEEAKARYEQKMHERPPLGAVLDK